jgi:hypothetical protein
MKHILCLTHPFSQSYCVHETHILCLTHPLSQSYCVHETHPCSKLYAAHETHSVPATPFSKSYGVHEAHILCLTHSLSNRMVSMNKAFMPDTPFQEVTCFSQRFCSSSARFFSLIIEWEQKGHKVTPCPNSKIIIFEFLTAMNVNNAVLWDVRPCTSTHRCRRFGGTMSPSS